MSSALNQLQEETNSNKRSAVVEFIVVSYLSLGLLRAAAGIWRTSYYFVSRLLLIEPFSQPEPIFGLGSSKFEFRLGLPPRLLLCQPRRTKTTVIQRNCRKISRQPDNFRRKLQLKIILL